MLQGRYEKQFAVRVHQHKKRMAIIQHEIKMVHSFLDRSHYKRHELQNHLAWVRHQISWNIHNKYYMKQLRWEWQVTYVQLRMCFKSPLPWEANRYCRWV